MLVLRKKRILFVALCIFIAMFSVMVSTQNNKTIQTVSLPVSNKVVIIDAGHGVPDEGVSLLH